MKITERHLKRIVKETLYHMAAAAAAGSAFGGGGGSRRGVSTDDASRSRPSTSRPYLYMSSIAAGTPQDLSDGKPEKMYDDLKKGKSKEFFKISDGYDMYTRAREMTVVMLPNVTEKEIAVDMKLYNRDNQTGGFTEENYNEWVDKVCPILKHSRYDFYNLKEIWESQTLTTESRLRQIIRNIIKENKQDNIRSIIQSILNKANNTVISVMGLVYEITNECQSGLHFEINEDLIDAIQTQMSKLIYPHTNPNIDTDMFHRYHEIIEYYGSEAVMLNIKISKFDQLVNNLEEIMSASSIGDVLKHGVDESGMSFADRIKKELGTDLSDNIDSMIDYVYEEMYIQSVKDGQSQKEAYQEALDYIKSFYNFEN